MRVNLNLAQVGQNNNNNVNKTNKQSFGAKVPLQYLVRFVDDLNGILPEKKIGEVLGELNCASEEIKIIKTRKLQEPLVKISPIKIQKGTPDYYYYTVTSELRHSGVNNAIGESDFTINLPFYPLQNYKSSRFIVKGLVESIKEATANIKED